MKKEEIIKANNILEKLDFFNQRSARKLWGDKPFDVQSQDIADRHKDIEYLKSFIEFQNKEIEKLRQAFETAVIERDIIQEQKDFECKKAVGKFAKELDDYYFSGNGSCSLSYVRKAIGTLLTDWLWR